MESDDEDDDTNLDPDYSLDEDLFNEPQQSRRLEPLSKHGCVNIVCLVLY